MIGLSFMFNIVHVYTHFWSYKENPRSKIILAPSILGEGKVELVMSADEVETDSFTLQPPLVFIVCSACARYVLGLFRQICVPNLSRPVSQGSWDSQRLWNYPKIPELVSDRAEFPSRFVLKWPSDWLSHIQRRMTAAAQDHDPGQVPAVTCAVLQILCRNLLT